MKTQCRGYVCIIAGAPNLPFKPHSKAHLITSDKAGMQNSVAGILQV